MIHFRQIYINCPSSAIAGDRVNQECFLQVRGYPWVHNSRLGAFLCRSTISHMSHQKASNPPDTNWIQVDSASSSQYNYLSFHTVICRGGLWVPPILRRATQSRRPLMFCCLSVRSDLFALTHVNFGINRNFP